MLTVMKENDYLDFAHGDTFICKEPWMYSPYFKPEKNKRYPLNMVKKYVEDRVDRHLLASTVNFEEPLLQLSIDLKAVGWYNYFQLSDEEHGFEETFELSDGTRVVAFGYVDGI